MSMKLEPGEAKSRENLPEGVNRDLKCPKFSERTCIECEGKIPYKSMLVAGTDKQMFSVQGPVASKGLDGVALTQGGHVCKRCWDDGLYQED